MTEPSKDNLTKSELIVLIIEYTLVLLSTLIPVISRTWTTIIYWLVFISVLIFTIQHHQHTKFKLKAATFPLIAYPCIQMPGLLAYDNSLNAVFVNLFLLLIMCWVGFSIYLYLKTKRVKGTRKM